MTVEELDDRTHALRATGGSRAPELCDPALHVGEVFPDARVLLSERSRRLVAAHFEEEEAVLLPVLDAALTPEQFHEQVVAPGRGH